MPGPAAAATAGRRAPRSPAAWRGRCWGFPSLPTRATRRRPHAERESSYLLRLRAADPPQWDRVGDALDRADPCLRPAIAVRRHLVELVGGEHARGARDRGQAAREVDRAAEPVARAAERLAGGES